MYVIVSRAQAGTNNPLPTTVDVHESPLPAKAVEMPVFSEVVAERNQDASASSSSSSSEEEKLSLISESSSSLGAPADQKHADDYQISEIVKQQMIAQQLQKLEMQHQQQLMNMTLKEYANYQKTM
ncbi:hypothetical protein HPB52_023566 [Rhipicephalus sanguineus]|uniref:Uncharacterized protein n=1 Tax=Rhipicephalus sanguineus TaxID=34632 RepID=A0A9D4PGU0_RHISA|nr:hypothetical protein HPB52_023566 [Rhipicephalus sanguineus]